MKRPSYEELSPGKVFRFFGPREGLLFRRGVAVGRVLALDPAAGVVHVRTLRYVPGTESETTVLIAFMPMLYSAFCASLQHLAAVGPSPKTSGLP
jgi:hypothetical protein